MLLLAKIQSNEFIHDMFNNEYLYFKSLKDFRGKNTMDGRLDSKELNVKNEQVTYLSVSVDNKEIASSKNSPKFDAQYLEYLDNPKINCCSLYSKKIEFDDFITDFDDRLNQMGEKMLVIFNYIKFFKILDQSLENLGFEYSRKQIIYYDPKTFDGKLTLHHKDFALSYQNEYRILIYPTDNQPIKIPIPGLMDISAIINTKDINLLQIRKN